MTRTKHICIAAAATLLGLPAAAQDFSAGAALTTFGPAVEGTYSIQPGLDVRGVAFVPLSAELNGIELEEGYTLDGSASTGAFALLADYYPTGSGFRVSGGLFASNGELASGTITDGATTFTGSLNMDRSIAPMIAGGYRYDFQNNWYLAGELGAIVSGFEVQSDTTDATALADIAEINDTLDDLPVYPYISISVGLEF